MDLAAFDYDLPEELIAQEPLADRAASRMLVVRRAEGRWEDRAFRDLPQFLGPGDCLVLNDSRVFPARLYGHRAGGAGAAHRQEQSQAARVPERAGGGVSAAAAWRADGREWEALVRPGRKMRVGERIRFEDGLEAEIVARGEFGERTVRFHGASETCSRSSSRIGHVPLPPYIKRAGSGGRSRAVPDGVSRARRGSVAAPTAGLHFTPKFWRDAGRAAPRWRG